MSNVSVRSREAGVWLWRCQQVSTFYQSCNHHPTSPTLPQQSQRVSLEVAVVAPVIAPRVLDVPELDAVQRAVSGDEDGVVGELERIELAAVQLVQSEVVVVDAILVRPEIVVDLRGNVGER